MTLPTGFPELHTYLVDDLGPVLHTWRDDAYADETWNGYKAWLAPSAVDNILEHTFAFDDELDAIYTTWNAFNYAQQCAILADAFTCYLDSLCPA